MISWPRWFVILGEETETGVTTMHLVFIDDSQQTNTLTRDLGPLVGLGGVVVRDEQIAA